VGTFVGVLAALYVFILLVDPYGVVPFSLPFERPIMSNQRQVYPQILRTGRYDSIIVGTSTSRLLDPAALSRTLGGHFASLAMPSMTAWEQAQVIDYFRRTVRSSRAVVVGSITNGASATAGRRGPGDRARPRARVSAEPMMTTAATIFSPSSHERLAIFKRHEPRVVKIVLMALLAACCVLAVGKGAPAEFIYFRF